MLDAIGARNLHRCQVATPLPLLPGFQPGENLGPIAIELRRDGRRRRTARMDAESCIGDDRPPAGRNRLERNPLEAAVTHELRRFPHTADHATRYAALAHFAFER